VHDAPSNDTLADGLEPEAPVEVIPEEEILGQTTVDQIEIEIIEEKLALLRKRMAYLTKQSGCKIGLGCISGRKVIPECLDDDIRE